MLSKSPDERPGSWLEVKEFLEEFRAKYQPPEPAAAVASEAVKPQRSGGDSPLPKILFAVSVVILTVILVGLFGALYWLMALKK